jgi:hypothetical protein
MPPPPGLHSSTASSSRHSYHHPQQFQHHLLSQQQQQPQQHQQKQQHQHQQLQQQNQPFLSQRPISDIVLTNYKTPEAEAIDRWFEVRLLYSVLFQKYEQALTFNNPFVSLYQLGSFIL